MGCCDFELEEMKLYQIVAKVKNQYRTGNVCGTIRCHLCHGAVKHEFREKQFIGFSVRIACPQCGWDFEG
jgi:hypothetical protein